MVADEKSRILTLFSRKSAWCRNAEARDEDGTPVQYDDPRAVSWDLPGGLCHLFGWRRTSVLLPQIERHITGKKRPYRYDEDPVIASLVALQTYNDCAETDYDSIHTALASMPVWAGAGRLPEATAQNVGSECETGPGS